MAVGKPAKKLNDLSMVVRARFLANMCLFWAMGCDCWPKVNLGDHKGAEPPSRVYVSPEG